MKLQPGTVFSFPIGEGQRGLGQVLSLERDVVGLALCGAVWDCEPLLEDVDEAPVALSVRVKVSRLAGTTALGVRPPVADTPDGPVIDAPLIVLMAALN